MQGKTEGPTTTRLSIWHIVLVKGQDLGNLATASRYDAGHRLTVCSGSVILTAFQGLHLGLYEDSGPSADGSGDRRGAPIFAYGHMQVEIAVKNRLGELGSSDADHGTPVSPKCSSRPRYMSCSLALETRAGQGKKKLQTHIIIGTAIQGKLWTNTGSTIIVIFFDVPRPRVR